MPPVKLIADSGATKTEWCLLKNGRKKMILTMGISPYLMEVETITNMLVKELWPAVKQAEVDEIHYYGTGCGNPLNVKKIQKALKAVFKGAKIAVDTDMMAAARALCGNEKGIACILGTGSNSCYFNGKKIVKNNPALGFILGDEGSGAYLGKKVLQYYLYKTFDAQLHEAFELKFKSSHLDILDHVYRQPLPNKYLASFTGFLAENRGHYMIENIIEDGLGDFIFQHLYKYRETWLHPIHFVGGVAHGFKDVLKELCESYELELGRVLQKPMDGLVKFHQ
jgi:glucosamine kinase